MFKNILIPLDGSSLAEAGLPAAASLAEKLNAPVTLLHIIEQNAPEVIHNERHLTRPQEAETYLQDLAKKSFPAEIKTSWHVHSSQIKDVPTSIVEHTGEFDPDLIIMCAHGRSGIRDMLFGRIAHQVVAKGSTPLLLLQPMISEKKPFNLRRILLPLDSESIHDDSFPIAKTLAKAYDAELCLLCVIPTFGTLRGDEVLTSTILPSTTNALLDIKEEHAKEHLQTHLNELASEGFRASAEIARGDPTQTIVNKAEHGKSDMIILSTHRKAGIDAFWARSVAPNVARRTRIPLLLIPLPPHTS
ncbi:MAG: universal stress protein [Chloroflexi bacterium]|nr:universal stress protein [Chloroflexota bacterium]